MRKLVAGVLQPRIFRTGVLQRRCLLFIIVSGLLLVAPARAQLATNFYNVTGIETRVLPNAVQVTIRTDGMPIYGADLNDFIDINTTFQPQPVTSLRLRLVSARSRLPAFVEIGAYPIDAAQVTLGRSDLVSPYFSSGGYEQPEPRVDIEFRFFVPVIVRRFGVEMGNPGISFGSEVGPRDIAVERGTDGSSIVITAVPDRFDVGGAARLRRSPEATHKHRLAVTPDATGTRYRFDALHTPLSDLLNVVSQNTQTPLLPLSRVADIDISLFLPAATLDEFFHVLRGVYNLSVSPRPSDQGGGFTIGRATETSVLERLPLQHLTPEKARLLFPDFLLARLRADRENNALVISGSPALVARLREDIARFDQPRPQVRIEANVWEFVDERTASFALSTALSRSWGSVAFDSTPGELTLQLDAAHERAFATTVQALVSSRRARLAARPFVVVTAGEQGTIFLGQNRFVTVLQNQGGQQNLDVVEIPIGYSLTAKPRAGAGDSITLDLSPRISTVDAIEPGTGLPTVGVRETSSTLRVRSGDTIIVAGLDAQLSFTTHGRLTRRSDRPWTSMILLLKVQKV